MYIIIDIMCCEAPLDVHLCPATERGDVAYHIVVIMILIFNLLKQYGRRYHGTYTWRVLNCDHMLAFLCNANGILKHYK